MLKVDAGPVRNLGSARASCGDSMTWAITGQAPVDRRRCTRRASRAPRRRRTIACVLASEPGHRKSPPFRTQYNLTAEWQRHLRSALRYPLVSSAVRSARRPVITVMPIAKSNQQAVQSTGSIFACGAQSLSKDGRFRSGFCGCATPLCPGATAKRTAHRFSR